MAANRSTDSSVARRGRRARRAVAAAAGAALIVAGVSGQSAAQGEPIPNFSLAGVNPQTGNAISVATVVGGDFSFCSNANGLGSELYFEATSATTGLTIRHASVSPMVVPIHFGVLDLNNPEPDMLVNDQFVVLGVVEGQSVGFGSTGAASAEFGGVAMAPTAAGALSWEYSGDATCDESRVMPIIEPLLSGGATTTTSTP